MLQRMFSKPAKINYGNIRLLAALVSDLYRYHQAFVVDIVDNVLEQITLGLELNDFKFNQQRIAQVKYLGELYNYIMVDSPVIFDTLYRIVTFGHRKRFDLFSASSGTKLINHHDRGRHSDSRQNQSSGFARRLFPHPVGVHYSGYMWPLLRSRVRKEEA